MSEIIAQQALGALPRDAAGQGVRKFDTRAFVASGARGHLTAPFMRRIVKKGVGRPGSCPGGTSLRVKACAIIRSLSLHPAAA
jgi:hypothetical protein